MPRSKLICGKLFFQIFLCFIFQQDMLEAYYMLGQILWSRRCGYIYSCHLMIKLGFSSYRTFVEQWSANGFQSPPCPFYLLPLLSNVHINIGFDVRFSNNQHILCLENTLSTWSVFDLILNWFFSDNPITHSLDQTNLFFFATSTNYYDHLFALIHCCSSNYRVVPNLLEGLLKQITGKL